VLYKAVPRGEIHLVLQRINPDLLSEMDRLAD
jgi:hypothetical protein